MDISRVSQGGQLNFDYTSQNTELVTGGQTSLQETTKTVDFKVNAVKESSEGTVKEEDVKKAVDKLNKLLEGEQTHAEYERHDKLGDMMIKIIDNNTKQVVLEVPPKKILDMVAKMMEMVGLLVDKKA